MSKETKETQTLQISLPVNDLARSLFPFNLHGITMGRSDEQPIGSGDLLIWVCNQVVIRKSCHTLRLMPSMLRRCQIYATRAITCSRAIALKMSSSSHIPPKRLHDVQILFQQPHPRNPKSRSPRQQYTCYLPSSASFPTCRMTGAVVSYIRRFESP